MPFKKGLKYFLGFASIFGPLFVGSQLIGKNRTSSGLEKLANQNQAIVQPAPEIEKPKLVIEDANDISGNDNNGVNEKDKNENSKYSYLKVYDQMIEDSVNYFNTKHKINLNPNLVKAMIVKESGSERFRDKPTYDDAFYYDPMQIANQGDYALDVLSDRKENTELIGDFSNLKGKKKTPWNKDEKCWDYSNTNMTTQDSIYGGIGWLVHKAAIYSIRTIELGEIKEYTVKKGDNLWDIAEANGTTIPTLKKYTQGITDNIVPGQKLKYKSAKEETYVSGWRSWKDAVEGYNGGGNKNYVNEVFSILRELDP